MSEPAGLPSMPGDAPAPPASTASDAGDGLGLSLQVAREESTTGAALQLLLASASSARLKTLVQAGIDPIVYVSDVDEDAAVARASQDRDLSPADVALLLARTKCEAVVGHIDDVWDSVDDGVDVTAALLEEDEDGPVHPELEVLLADLVLGCDSVLELDGEVHGKPGTADVARERWRRMRGRSGVLHTGHWLMDVRHPDDGGTEATFGAVASTTVHFADIPDDEIDAYVATGEPLWVAGAFTLDGLGGPFIEAIEGDHHNVVGLSLPLFRRLLDELDIPWYALRNLRRSPF